MHQVLAYVLGIQMYIKLSDPQGTICQIGLPEGLMMGIIRITRKSR